MAASRGALLHGVGVGSHSSLALGPVGAPLCAESPRSQPDFSRHGSPAVMEKRGGSEKKAMSAKGKKEQQAGVGVVTGPPVPASLSPMPSPFSASALSWGEARGTVCCGVCCGRRAREGRGSSEQVQEGKRDPGRPPAWRSASRTLVCVRSWSLPRRGGLS